MLKILQKATLGIGLAIFTLQPQLGLAKEKTTLGDYFANTEIQTGRRLAPIGQSSLRLEKSMEASAKIYCERKRNYKATLAFDYKFSRERDQYVITDIICGSNRDFISKGRPMPTLKKQAEAQIALHQKNRGVKISEDKEALLTQIRVSPRDFKIVDFDGIGPSPLRVQAKRRAAKAASANR